MRRSPLIFLLTIFSLILSQTSILHASGLSVQPATYLFKDIPVGTRIKLPVPMVIHNRDDRPHTYIITAFKPSEIGMQWPEGYIELPDAVWFSFDEKEVTIAGGGIKSVNMYLHIPGGDAYYNQKWVVAAGVTARVGSGESVVLAVYPRFLIETESRGKISIPPEMGRINHK